MSIIATAMKGNKEAALILAAVVIATALKAPTTPQPVLQIEH